MKLGKLLGRIGFVIGFVTPLLFYAVPLTYESHVICPLCPILDVAFAHPLLWLQIGLESGLLQGALFGILGFVVGYLISRFRPTPRQPVKPH